MRTQLEFDFQPKPPRWGGLKRILWGKRGRKPTEEELLSEYARERYQVEGAVAKAMLRKLHPARRARVINRHLKVALEAK